jgi:hypothetical protein
VPLLSRVEIAGSGILGQTRRSALQANIGDGVQQSQFGAIDRLTSCQARHPAGGVGLILSRRTRSASRVVRRAVSSVMSSGWRGTKRLTVSATRLALPVIGWATSTS